MMNPRFLFSTFCDDIRVEQGNKFSIMGCYDQTLLVSEFPITLPKLCFVIVARTPTDRPFKELKFRLFRNEDLVGEIEPVIPDQLENPVSEKDNIADSASCMTVRAVIQLANLVLDGPCYFKVRALTEEEEPLKGGILHVRALVKETKIGSPGPRQLPLPPS
jgi:hypothetical protein